MAKLSVDEIVAAVKELSVLELSELVKKLEEEFGVSAAAPVAVAAAPAAAAAATQPAEEKTSFDVVLTDVGAQKIKVLKVIREITGLGLKESKELVDKVPSVVKSGVSKEEAEEIKKKLEEQGAKVEIK